MDRFFRGVDVKTKQLVYGNYVYDPTEGTHWIYGIDDILTDNDDRFTSSMIKTEIFKNTLCQYTGFHAKGNLEIYEKDNVKGITLDDKRVVQGTVKFAFGCYYLDVSHVFKKNERIILKDLSNLEIVSES